MATSFVMVSGRPTIAKDPDAILDYSWDWSAWLAGDTITSQVVTVEAGLTLVVVTRLNGVVTAVVSGGTAGSTLSVACRITTSGGRTDERTIYLQIASR